MNTSLKNVDGIFLMVSDNWIFDYLIRSHRPRNAHGVIFSVHKIFKINDYFKVTCVLSIKFDSCLGPRV